MTIDNLRTSDTALKSLEASDLTLQVSGPASNSEPRKMNRVSCVRRDVSPQVGQA